MWKTLNVPARSLRNVSVPSASHVGLRSSPFQSVTWSWAPVERFQIQRSRVTGDVWRLRH